MPSLRSRLLFFMFKYRHLFSFRLKKEIIDWNAHSSILRFRQECERGAYHPEAKAELLADKMLPVLLLKRVVVRIEILA
jgi:hypothetical protein